MTWARRDWCCAGTALLALGVGGSLTGCASFGAAHGSADAGASRFVGRMALRVDATANQPAQAVSFAFELTGTAQAGQFTAASPLGTLLARVSWQAGEARVEANGQVDRFASLAAAVRQFTENAGLALDLPVTALFAWLGGQPLAGQAFSPQADGFEQLGWRVGTASAADGRVSADWPGPPAASVRVILER